MTAHFDNDDFQFGLESALGCAYRQAADYRVTAFRQASADR